MAENWQGCNGQTDQCGFVLAPQINSSARNAGPPLHLIGQEKEWG